jgi:hypothetical protein
VKVLRPHVIGDDEARARLAREVSSLTRVRSPRIAEVIDADPWGETPYVATRYVPGPSLHEHVRREGPLTGSDLTYFAAGLAEAMSAVHGVGVLHRDIKPSNVLLEGRAPVLIDFGLARLAEDPRLTHTGWLLGTPGYLAPEILYGEDATPASDVHAWAATVAFAATGRPPYGTGPAMAIMDRVRRGEHDLSAVPLALQPLLRSCLAPDPHDRPDTVAVLASLRGRVRPVWAPAGPGEPTVPVRQDRPTTATVPLTVPAQPAIVAERPRLLPQEAWRPAPARLPRLQRAVTLAATFAAVALGFARAPYVALGLLCLAALLVRTVSWTTESARERQVLRGRRRWYDAPLTVLSTPWYLVVATAGTLVLLLWSASVALVVGIGYVLFRLPLEPGLLLMGAALALATWWGPGSRRLRLPTRRLLLAATGRPWTGWLAVAVALAAAAVCAFAVLGFGVSWAPKPGPPWRGGTLLGELVRWL